MAMEVDMSQAGVLYTTPGSTSDQVGVLARGLTITLGKQLNLFCMQLSRQKFG